MRQPLIYCVLSLLLPYGCSSGPTSVVTGGTEGLLIVGDNPIPDFEVRVFEVGSTNPLGMGITGIKTPLRVKWRSANQTLELKVPAFKQ